MECKYCKTLNADDATYCKNCGKRLDGKKNCPACGAFIEEDSVYCNVCGARVDGKVVCKNCGTVHDGTYCPQCGGKTVQADLKTKKRADAVSEKSKDKTINILNYISLACGITLAALSVIFVCLIGVKLSGAEGLTEAENTTIGIFDYFGKEFQDIKDVLDAGGTAISSAYKAALYLPAVTGLVSLVVSLAGTVGFAITAAVKCIINIVKKNNKNATLWVLLAFGFYIFGVSMIMSINAANVSSSPAGVDASVFFNEATIAGIVLCTVMVAGAVGCDTANYFLSGKITSAKIIERTLSVLVVVGAVITVAMLSSSVSTLRYIINSGDYSVKFKIGMGLPGMFVVFLTLNGYDSELPLEVLDDVDFVENNIIIGQVFIFVAVMAALMFIVSLMGGRGKRSRALSVVSSGIFLASALVALVTTVLAGNKFIEMIMDKYAENSFTYSFDMTYGAVITAFVFAVVAFAGNICRVFFTVRQKREDNYNLDKTEAPSLEQA